jgi:hypothetical protein
MNGTGVATGFAGSQLHGDGTQTIASEELPGMGGVKGGGGTNWGAIGAGGMGTGGSIGGSIDERRGNSGT